MLRMERGGWGRLSVARSAEEGGKVFGVSGLRFGPDRRPERSGTVLRETMQVIGFRCILGWYDPTA